MNHIINSSKKKEIEKNRKRNEIQTADRKRDRIKSKTENQRKGERGKGWKQDVNRVERFDDLRRVMTHTNQTENHNTHIYLSHCWRNAIPSRLSNPIDFGFGFYWKYLEKFPKSHQIFKQSFYFIQIEILYFCDFSAESERSAAIPYDLPFQNSCIFQHCFGK